MNNSPINFVSLGPGNPDLITIGALKALQQADYIYCPGTRTKTGKTISRSKDIISQLDISLQKVQLFEVPMDADGTKAIDAYNKVSEIIAEVYKEGKNIAVVANGHNGLYSSGFYIGEVLEKMGLPIRQLAGIPAFIASGTLAKLHIAKHEEPLVILPRIQTMDEIRKYVADQCQIVLMKPSISETYIKQIIKEVPNIEVHYFENTGVQEKEFYSCNKEIILQRKFPYFSLLILKS